MTKPSAMVPVLAVPKAAERRFTSLSFSVNDRSADLAT